MWDLHHRARRWATLVLLIGLAAALLWFASWREWRASRPGELNRWPPARPDFAGAVGVNLAPSELEPENLPHTLDWLARAGIRWVRLRLPWDQVEPARGEFAWSRWDAVFSTLASQPGLQVVVVLDGSPAWARSPVDANNPLAPPHERADFGAFAAAVARRYGGYLRYYQIWDEPNIAPHWGARPADPLDYLGLLREAAVQIRAADPDAWIVLAALAPTTEPGGANLSDLAFLDALYRLAARAWFDVVAVQPYGFSEGPEAPADPGRLNFGRAALLYEVALCHGDAAVPLWATSFGWNALPADWSGQPSPWGQVDEDDQARYAAGAFDLAATRWPWLGPLFWAAGCPSDLAPDDPWRGFALCAPDGTPRGVWQALATAAQRPALLPPGDHRPNHPALHYSPGWRVTAHAADPTADGDILTWEFYGSGLALRVQGGPYWAYYRIAVDGAPANALPRDEKGNAYLVLYDPVAEVRVVPVARGLPLGRHQVRLEAVGGWGQWALQGVLVSATTQQWPGWQLWAGLAGLMTALWGAVVWLWRPWAGENRPARAGRTSLHRWLERVTLSDLRGILLGCSLVLALLFSHWLPLDLALLAGLGLLFLIRPDLALPFIAASLPLWPRPKALGQWAFSLFELLVLLAWAGLLVRWLVAGGWGQEGQKGRRRTGGLDGPVLALLLVGLVAALAAEHRHVALREWRQVFLEGVLWYWLITRAPWPAGRRFSPWPAVDGLLVGMVLVSGLGLWQLVTGQGRVDVEGVWRVRALYGSPNNLALVLDRAVPLALALAAFGCFPAKRGKVRRGLYLLATVVTGGACLATFSKGALLLGLPAGVGVVLVAGAWRARARWPLGLLAGCLALGGVGLALLFRTPRFAGLLNFEGGTAFFRLKLWQGAWQMALDHPWLGVGPDNFLYAYRTRYVLPSAWQELNLSHPHNIILDLWTRLGLAGVAVGAWALVAAARRGWYLLRSADRPLWPLALGLLAGLAATLAHGLGDNSLFLVDLMGLFMLTLGLLQRLGWQAQEDELSA